MEPAGGSELDELGLIDNGQLTIDNEGIVK